MRAKYLRKELKRWIKSGSNPEILVYNQKLQEFEAVTSYVTDGSRFWLLSDSDIEEVKVKKELSLI